MSELGRATDDKERRIDEYNSYMRLRQAAFHTDGNITQSWLRPKRHNRVIEQRALYWAVCLDDECTTAIESGLVSPRPETADVATRYEVEASIRTVRATLPFNSRERAILANMAQVTEISNYEFQGPAGLPDRRLVERWHRWLWMDENGEPQTSVAMLAGSAILGEAAGRLSDAVLEVANSIWAQCQPEV